MTSAGSRPSRAASTSPWFSRSSGGIHGSSTVAYTSSSVAPATRAPVASSKTPYSLMRKPRREASSRTFTLCSLDPVKYCSAAPNAWGSTTRRSMARPSWWRTEAFVGPWASTSTIEGRVVSVRITRSGSVEVTSRSMSLTDSFMRRSEPAISSRSTPPCARSASPTCRAMARAVGSSVRLRPALHCAMALRMFSHVFSRMPATPMISLERHSASSRSTESTPRCS